MKSIHPQIVQAAASARREIVEEQIVERIRLQREAVERERTRQPVAMAD
jgi:hypothetical protein